MKHLATGLLAGLVAVTGALRGQDLPRTASDLVVQTPTSTLPPPQGTVLFSTESVKPAAAAAPVDAPVPELTGADRTAITFTSYDLDVHLVPATARITVRAGLMLRNDGATPLHVLPLQISSSLRWESLSLAGAPAAFLQHLIDTDADHTGRANEAVVTLSGPLAPGASLALTAFYSGDIHPDATRLERIGAPADKAALADWDAIAPALTGLRGFGNVLWYPVAAEPVFLGDGAKLFQAVGKSKLRQAQATVRLRLAVEYTGDAPDGAFFRGLRQPLLAVKDNSDLPAAESTGVATAEFPAEPLGFRVPSLFITDRAATVTDDGGIAAVTDHYDAVPRYAAAADQLKPLLTEWLGPRPLSPLTILDHPGQPFEDDALLVAPLRGGNAANLAPTLVHSLTHAWFRSSHAWLDEGVPQFLSLLGTERTEGRDAALQSLEQAATTLAFAEPASGLPGQSLVAATDDVYLRTKAAAVLWMLRYVAGDDAVQQTLLVYRNDAKLDADPMGFEVALEKNAHKDLRWFFDDWVYRDRGLPDLTIVHVAPRQLPSQTAKPGGWLVAVEVRNEGDAGAEVPVTVRAGSGSNSLTATERLRVPGRGSASTRILFGAVPEEVQVNDGSVPELRTSLHTMQIQSRAQ